LRTSYPALAPIKKLIAKYTAFFTSLLAHFGIWGPMVIATADAAAFGIPMDPVIIGYAWGARDRLWLIAFYCVSSAVGSAVGSLAPYWIGRKGGEPLLLKRISHQRLEELRDRYESWEFFFIMVPCLLPPGTPMKAIIAAAGAFEMRQALFLAAMFLGRLLRFIGLSFLVVRFGPGIVEMSKTVFREHQMFMWITLGVMALVFLAYLAMRKKKK
jgi:membrane protein YqaA with SNARE-associated domain